MPSPNLPLDLRAARPLASPELRERVRSLGAATPLPRRRVAFPPVGRLLLAGAATAVTAGLAIAVAHGLTHSNGPSRPTGAARLVGEAGRVGARPVQRPSAYSATVHGEAIVPPTAARLQQYGASLGIQVKDRAALSDTTKRAMRVARLLGGYVASVRYSAPRHRVGAATIVVRVPIERVDDAVAEYADLGTLLRQKLALDDVTRAVQEQAREIARLRTDIERLEAGGVTAGERPRLEAEQARLDYLMKRRDATVRRAQLARVALTLTTKPHRGAAAKSRFDRTLDDAGGVLLREGEILLYALIVAGPLLILGAAAVAGSRLAHRRRDADLLERT